jgi:hypothetical protein
MSMEPLAERELTGETEELDENRTQCLFLHSKSHMI